MVVAGGGSTIDIYYLHGWFMWSAWGILGMVQIASIRYGKFYWRYNFIIHLISGLYILIITIILSLFLIRELDWEIINLTHNAIGFLILLVVGIIVIVGLITKYLMSNAHKSKLMLKVKYAHRVIILITI